MEAQVGVHVSTLKCVGTIQVPSVVVVYRRVWRGVTRSCLFGFAVLGCMLEQMSFIHMQHSLGWALHAARKEGLPTSKATETCPERIVITQTLCLAVTGML